MQLTTDGTIHYVAPEQGEIYSLSELQKSVGGYIDILVNVGKPLSTGRRVDMVINEEGKLEGLPQNLVASIFAWHNKAIDISDCIVGDVLFTTHDSERNTVALTKAECAELSEWIGKRVAIHEFALSVMDELGLLNPNDEDND